MEAIADCALDLLEASKKALRDPVAKKPVHIAITIETGPCVSCITGTSIPKFDLVGKIVDHASIMMLDSAADAVIIGPVTKGCLPGMFKMKDYKDISGVGMCSQLQDKDGRKPLQDKDIKTSEPIVEVKAEAGGDKGGAPAAAAGGDGGGGGGGGDAPAPAGGGGGDDAPAGDGGAAPDQENSSG